MSRSCNSEIKNPASKFIEWSGSKGIFKYYDKETEKQIEIPLPFRFLALDTLSTIKGFSDADSSGFWSNEIRDLKSETFIVRTKKGICFKGYYDALAGSRDCSGAKYCQSVYIAYHNGTSLEIANLQIHGSALGAWIEFRKKNKIFEGAIEVKEITEGKKGTTTYQIPVFKSIATKPETDLAAKKLDTELQEYLKLYFNKPKEEIPEKIEAEIASEEMPVITTGGKSEEPIWEQESSDMPF